jgi:DNA modification methylase
MDPLILRADAACLPLPDASVDLIVTSPPYFGQRLYTDGGLPVPGQVGAEDSPKAYVANLLACTEEWARVLRPEGSLFVNIADKYAAYNRNRGASKSISRNADPGREVITAKGLPPGTRNKSLMGLPERYMLACMDELGLTCRAVVVWRKHPPMPERVRDRCPTAHEVILHFTRRDRYFFSERAVKALGAGVWDITVQPFRPPAHLTGADKHYAAFPVELPRRCVLGWSPAGGVVLDPFGGTGTTALAAVTHGRTGISCDLSQGYSRLASWRVMDPNQRFRAITRPPRSA